MRFLVADRGQQAPVDAFLGADPSQRPLESRQMRFDALGERGQRLAVDLGQVAEETLAQQVQLARFLVAREEILHRGVQSRIAAALGGGPRELLALLELEGDLDAGEQAFVHLEFVRLHDRVIDLVVHDLAQQLEGLDARGFHPAETGMRALRLGQGVGRAALREHHHALAHQVGDAARARRAAPVDDLLAHLEVGRAVPVARGAGKARRQARGGHVCRAAVERGIDLGDVGRRDHLQLDADLLGERARELELDPGRAVLVDDEGRRVDPADDAQLAARQDFVEGISWKRAGV